MIFVFRPSNNSRDRIEQLVYEFAEDVLQNASCEITDFSCDRNLVRFKREVENFDGSDAVFMAYCHGSPNKLYVISRGDISISSDDAGIFREKLCYLVACSSLKGLGRAMKEAGAHGVVGYSRPLVLIFPEVENYEAVKRCVNSGIIHWLQNGGDAEEVYNIIKAKYDEELRRLDETAEIGIQTVPIYGALRANRASLGFF